MMGLTILLQSHPPRAPSATSVLETELFGSKRCQVVTQSLLQIMLSLLKRPLIYSAASLSRSSSTSWSSSRAMSSLPSWATVDPASLGSDAAASYLVPNLVDGHWTTSATTKADIIHPLDKTKPAIFQICDTQAEELQPYLESLRKVTKSGLHNPFKNPERYVQYGEISRRVRIHVLWWSHLISTSTSSDRLLT